LLSCHEDAFLFTKICSEAFPFADFDGCARRKRERDGGKKKEKKTHFFTSFPKKKTLFQLKSLLESKFRTIDDFRVETERLEAEATVAVAAAAKAKEEEKSKA
jgi:hypothetical protein